ncbi:MAG TPA: enoyl-CoA hydratase-related protein [Candidatus Acidoferrales bacterium]|nr:enoyl-CoA hydratase-related protein [Candidatus Acidoferrales bacterium]
MPSEQSLLYQEEKGIARIIFNRPQALNALSRDLLQELLAQLENVRGNEAVKAVILTGAGKKAFSAGADIEFLHRASPLEVREFARLAVSVTHQIETLGKVVVAAINGFALGGGMELAESCMLRIAVRGARLGHPEVSIGAIGGFGGTTRLPRLIGKGRAAELLLTGRVVTAEEALNLGLVHQVVEAENLVSAAEDVLLTILSHSPVAIRLTWEALHRGMNLSLEESVLLGADYFGLAAASDDFRNGTKAFLEKTRPSFTGH